MDTPKWRYVSHHLCPLGPELSALDIDQLLLDTADHTENAIELRLVVVGCGGWDKGPCRNDQLGEVFCHDCVVDGGISRIMQPKLWGGHSLLQTECNISQKHGQKRNRGGDSSVLQTYSWLIIKLFKHFLYFIGCSRSGLTSSAMGAGL